MKVQFFTDLVERDVGDWGDPWAGSKDGHFVGKGSRIIKSRRHDKVDARIDEECKEKDSSSDEGRNGKSPVFLRKISQSDCVEPLFGKECPNQIDGKEEVGAEPESETVNGSIGCRSWARFRIRGSSQSHLVGYL